MSDDNPQQPAGGTLEESGIAVERATRGTLDGRAWSRTWRRWLAVATWGSADAHHDGRAPSHPPSVHAIVSTLPTRLDSSSLPNGVVELLIDDFEEPTRQLFDIHDGTIALVEPGAALPWTCIAGPPTAWVLALGPTRDTTALRLTGDERLARCVLAALPRGD